MGRSKRAVAVVLLGCLTMVLSGCGYKVTADISKYANSKIQVLGVNKGSVTMTVSDLSKLNCKKKKITTKSSGGEVTVTAVGPSLEDLLKGCGSTISDFESVKFTAKDGYVKELNSDFFVVHPDLYLSLCNGENPLKKDEQPVRLVIPGVTADNWVKGVVKIEVK